jgi:hypothetical protein
VHSNRVVIHPDYVGVGLGIRLATEAARIMHSRGFKVKAKFTSPAMYRQRINHPEWLYLASKLIAAKKDNGIFGRTIKAADESAAARRNTAKLWGVRYHWFQFRPIKNVTLSRETGPIGDATSSA